EAKFSPPLLVHNQIKTKSSNRNYFVRHWRGELSLPVSWWINGFILNLVLGGLSATLFASQEEFLSPRVILFLLFINLLIYVWQIVGIWRSAKYYVERAEGSTPPRSGAWG